MLRAFAFDRLGVVVGDLYFKDPNPAKGQEGPEHGVRLELRVINRGEPKGSIYAAIPIDIAEPIWRVDLLESVDGTPGSHDRTHHHPDFSGWDPTARVFARDLMQDPFGWLEAQLADLPEIIRRAGFPADTASAEDEAGLRDSAPEIAAAAKSLLDRVRTGELGQPPGDADAEGIRAGWL
jgi:hypothetical protein